jgi:hypothetical protein
VLRHDLAGDDETEPSDLPLRGLEETKEVELFGPSLAGVLYRYPDPAIGQGADPEIDMVRVAADFVIASPTAISMSAGSSHGSRSSISSSSP